MFKIAGSFLVILSCAMIGYEKATEVTKHRKDLEELQRIFIMVQTELKYIKTPFKDLFLKLHRKTNGRFKEWLLDMANSLNTFQQGTLEEIWSSSVDKHLKESFLTKNELEELRQIGKHISHMEALDLFLTQIEGFIQQTREEEKSKKKMYQSMGIMVGIFLVIMLI